MTAHATDEGTAGAPRRVIDEMGRVHRLGRCLGRGGQGAVFEVEGGRLAAKLLPGGSTARGDHLRQRLGAVRRLPLDGLPVARPMELLAMPQLGYLMPLLTGVDSLRHLIRPGGGRTPTPEWYAETGGLRRRLRLLSRLADAFARLHGRALAYGDPSPANILVSSSLDGEQVWLIDCDNLSFESSPTAASSMLFTPGYGAPELFAGRAGVSTLTDAHAFAVIAYQSLVLAHPLLGDHVLEGNPGLEDEAYAGAFPWIDAPDDDRNRSRHGIERSVVIAPRLAQVFHATFGGGLLDPLRRPGCSALADALNSAADFTTRCGSCEGTHYANARHCPWCGAPASPFVLARIYRWDPVDRVTLGARMLHALVVERGRPHQVSARIAGAPWQDGGVHLSVQSKGVDAWTTGDVEAWISLPDGSRQRALHSTPVTLPVANESTSWFIHCGRPTEPHRIITLSAMGHRQ